jgi:hypothetical protein
MDKTISKLPIYYFKKDKYLRARGGKTKLIDIYCASCNALLLIYQKDLPRGALKRCYLDRIFYPLRYSSLQQDNRIKGIEDMPKLQCESCKAVIGTPIRYTKHGENRLAYNLIQGKFVKKNSVHGIGKDK